VNVLMSFIASAVAVSALLHLQNVVLAGRVVDVTDAAVPGATVRISGPAVSATAVSDESGRFQFNGLAAGSHLLTVSLAGFRTQTRTIDVHSAPVPPLIVRLRTRPLVHVDWIVPRPVEAYRQAAAIVHLRIDRTLPSGPCGDAQIVTAHHEASVLRGFKGQLPQTIRFEQEAAGRCSEIGKWHEGNERPYRAGQEYVVFLTERRGALGRLAGPSLAFRVDEGLVSLAGFAGVQGSISLTEFGELLARLSRSVRVIP
jgi:hypothetical protein